MTQTIKQRRIKVADYYSTSGYGQGRNKANVYLIDGYYYAYHPKYANQAFHPLTGEFAGYVPCNIIHMSEFTSFYQCDPQSNPILSPHKAA